MYEREKGLVELVLSGNSEAFEPLVKPYRKRLLYLAYRLTQNWDDAMEVCQETMLRAFKYLRKYDSRKSFKNWIFKIMLNAARNYIKKNLPFDTDSLGRIEALDLRPEEKQATKEFQSQLLESLKGLSPREREIFLLRDIDEWSVKETAKIVGCSTGAVRVHLCSARKKIKQTIKEKFPHWLEK